MNPTSHPNSNELNPIQHQINISTASHDQPPLNLPFPDLLDERREDYNKICVPLYKASLTGDWKAAKAILDTCPELVRFSITENYETVLHVAVLGRSYLFVEYLVRLMDTKDLELQNKKGQTALYLAATGQDVRRAKLLVRKNKNLLNIPDNQGMMRSTWLLYLEITIWIGIPNMESDSLKLLRIIWTEIVKLPKDQIDDIIRGPPDQPKGDEKEASSEKEKHEAIVLLRTISDNIANMPAKIFSVFRSPVDKKKTWEDPKQKYSSRVLFLAAEMGNTAFIIEVIRKYPHLVWEVNDKNQSIFHVAISHRHEGIYNLLYEIGSLRNLIVTLEDKNGNNMLHLAGESAKINRLQDIPGVGLQLHLETLWFKEVSAILPPPLREKKNAAGLTPHEVFTRNHKDLFSKGEEWIKETAAQLMVVASLIATISFAAAFTFPGGYDQVTGVPILIRKQLSKIFIIFDGLSFVSSTTSILLVLSILGSDYTEHDFMISLPQQLMICLASLFISIATMILAFLTHFILLYQHSFKWIPVFISSFAGITYLIFGSPKFPLIGRFLYGSRLLFQRERRMLKRPIF
ncbi:hypothetical protein OSB04_012073 [Centaurea solstitialis]|uniref:PGG domain-containing protein n=1 Tax=Centaurea solstitialis TaxID=347529 RepID=A0AA38TAP6_9ASTR|nr:hypothetical protein OSB04_012073 [Centaurea solstitialis]